MDWLLIGVVAGSLIISPHTTEEGCEGRKAMVLKTEGAKAKCNEFSKLIGTDSGYIIWNGTPSP